MLPRYPAFCQWEHRSCRSCLDSMVRVTTTAPQSQVSAVPKEHFTLPAEFGAGIWQLLSPQNLVSVDMGSFIMGSDWTISSVRWPGAEVTLVIKGERGQVLTTFLLLVGTQPQSISAVFIFSSS